MMHWSGVLKMSADVDVLERKYWSGGTEAKTHAQDVGKKQPPRASVRSGRSNKQVSIWNELLCCVVAVASAGTAVTAAASASAAVVTALA